MNDIDKKLEELRSHVSLLKGAINNIIELKAYIATYEKSIYNPMYYIYYPQESSVRAAKLQLKGAVHGLKVLEKRMHGI